MEALSDSKVREQVRNLLWRPRNQLNRLVIHCFNSKQLELGTNRDQRGSICGFRGLIPTGFQFSRVFEQIQRGVLNFSSVEGGFDSRN